MVRVDIGPGGVQRICLVGSAEEQSRSMERWPIIRRELARLNRQLEREALDELLREIPRPPDRNAPERA
jgi:hypothetical protein